MTALPFSYGFMTPVPIPVMPYGASDAAPRAGFYIDGTYLYQLKPDGTILIVMHDGRTLNTEVNPATSAYTAIFDFVAKSRPASSAEITAFRSRYPARSLAQSAVLSASPAGATRPMKGDVWSQALSLASRGLDVYSASRGLSPQSAMAVQPVASSLPILPESAPAPFPWGIVLAGGAGLAVLLLVLSAGKK